MKFRVLEVKDSGLKPVFYPQYKSFLFWKNVGENWFSETVFNRNNNFTVDQPFVFNLTEGQDIIKRFQSYLKNQESYSKTHLIK